MSIAENKALAERWIKAWNDRDVAAIDEVCAPSCIHHNIGNLQQIKEVAARIFAESPDTHYTIDEMIAEGDKVVVRYTWHRTRGIRKFVTFGISIMRFENGKMVEDRNESSGPQRME